jgi:hypothetical protein
MAVSLVVRLVHSISSLSADERDEGAAQVTDVVRDLSVEDATVLAHVLVATRLVETNARCQEQQLHSLATLAEWHDLSAEVLNRLRFLPPDSVDAQQAEYLAELLPSL